MIALLSLRTLIKKVTIALVHMHKAKSNQEYQSDQAALVLCHRHCQRKRHPRTLIALR